MTGLLSDESIDFKRKIINSRLKTATALYLFGASQDCEDFQKTRFDAVVQSLFNKGITLNTRNDVFKFLWYNDAFIRYGAKEGISISILNKQGNRETLLTLPW